MLLHYQTKLELLVWDMMCEQGLVDVGFMSRSTIVLIGALRVKIEFLCELLGFMWISFSNSILLSEWGQSFL